MPYNEFFKTNQPFHIISRAVEERKIFEKEEDCYRFIFQVYAANVGKPAFNLWKRDIVKAAKALLEGEEVSSKFIIQQHPPLVDILDFSLVINHYHFYLIANVENGVPLFMRKLNDGFAKYINLKYERKGALFGGRYKRIPIKTEFHSDAVSRYVSIINPLDVYRPGWRGNGLNDADEAFNFLKNYQFSSFPDRMAERKSKIIAPLEILERYCPTSNLPKEEYIRFVNAFLKNRLSSLQPFFLE